MNKTKSHLIAIRIYNPLLWLHITHITGDRLRRCTFETDGVIVHLIHLGQRIGHLDPLCEGGAFVYHTTEAINDLLIDPTSWEVTNTSWDPNKRCHNVHARRVEVPALTLFDL